MSSNSSTILTKSALIPKSDCVVVARSAASTALSPRDTRPSKSPTEERVPLTPPPASYGALGGELRMDEEAHGADSCRLQGEWLCSIVKIQPERNRVGAVGNQNELHLVCKLEYHCDTHRRIPLCQFSRRRRFGPCRITSLTVPFETSLLLCNCVRITAVQVTMGLPQRSNDIGGCIDGMPEVA